MIFNKYSKTTQWGKDCVFNKWCLENQTVTYKIMNLEPYLTPYANVNSKCIKDLNIGPITTNLLKHRGKTSCHWLWQWFLHMTSEAQKTKAKIEKWHYIKLKNLCISKDTMNWVKRQPSEWEKITANHMSDKGLIFRLYKEFL